MDYQPALLDALRTLRARDAANAFKARAYQTVIQQLEQIRPIRSMEEVAHLRGVGDKIKQKMEEVFATGHLQSAEKARASVATLTAFQQIYGVGPVKAAELAPLFQGVDDPIAELREAITLDPTLLNDKQKIGLQYYEDLLKRIPRAEMDAHRDLLAQHFRGATLMGSYRRGLATSGDIDVLLPEGVPLAATVKQMQKTGYLVEILALGPRKCMAICRLPSAYGPLHPARRLDLMVTPEVEMPFALLYFTGSGPFNVAFRQHALTMGYSINEHKATPMGQSPPVPIMRTEEDIFRWLGLRYVAPEERVDAGQIKKM